MLCLSCIFLECLSSEPDALQKILQRQHNAFDLRVFSTIHVLCGFGEEPRPRPRPVGGVRYWNVCLEYFPFLHHAAKWTLAFPVLLESDELEWKVRGASSGPAAIRPSAGKVEESGEGDP